jgi:formylglycine-generating enzyme required for sulfatase activity
MNFKLWKYFLTISILCGAGHFAPLAFMPTWQQAVAQQQKKVALVIGNSAYKESPLENPVNDARLMAETLQKLGFQVIKKENVQTNDGFLSALSELEQQLTAGGIGLVFYAGHGIQLNGQNYLIPTQAVIEQEAQVRYKALNLDDVLQTLERTKSKMNIVILDACRNNPYEKRFRSGGGRGLAIVQPPMGSIVAYATAAGSVASDGTGANGLYTSALVKALQKPGLKVEDVFKETKREVIRLSNNQQRPGEYSELTEDFYFLPSGTPVTPPVALATSLPTPQPVRVPVSVPTQRPVAVSTPRPTQNRPESVSNSLGMEFKLIPAGSFMMGSPLGESGREGDETPHHVTLTESYYMQTTEVTQGQWQAVMGTSVSQQRDKADPKWALAGEGSNYPMYYVSWEEVQEYIRRLNGRGEGTYRLPTEAEWEYAARGKRESAYGFGGEASELYRFGNYADKSVIGKGNDKVDSWADKNHEDGYPFASPVRSYASNAYGLYDMHGNVWEWVSDWYGGYPSGSVSDPQGSSSGSYRVIRGGSWGSNASGARSANRSADSPGLRDCYLGFRLLRRS